MGESEFSWMYASALSGNSVTVGVELTMTKRRRSHSGSFKAKVALKAVGSAHTVSEIAAAYELHPNLVTSWKKHLVDRAADVFNPAKSRSGERDGKLEAELYEQIGRLKMELEWLKKKAHLFD